MKTTMRWVVGLAMLGSTGCAAGAPGDGDSFGPIGLDPGDPVDDDGGATDADPVDGDPNDPGDDGTDGSGPPTDRCDAIDLLFVVEAPQRPYPNDEQLLDCNLWYDDAAWQQWWEASQPYRLGYDQLRNGFASLVSELYVTVDVSDFRVMVTGSQIPTAKAWGWNPQGDLDCQPFELGMDSCDQTLGAGRNGFVYDPAIELGIQGSNECMSERFLTSGAEDLESTFSCLVDEYGSWEWFLGDGYWGASGYSGEGPDTMMDAMLAAVGPAGSTCNAGFLRDDALLVVVMLEIGGDGLEDTSSGSVAQWRDALVAAKGGDESRVVLLTLSPDADDEHPLCPPSQTSALSDDLRALTDSLPYGLRESSCLPSYPTFFSRAAEIIDEACGGAPTSSDAAG